MVHLNKLQEISSYLPLNCDRHLFGSIKPDIADDDGGQYAAALMIHGSAADDDWASAAAQFAANDDEAEDDEESISADAVGENIDEN